MSAAWIVLLLAGLFEVGWAVGLKWSDGFTKLLPALATIVSMVISVVLLARAMEVIPLGTAYTVWTAIGAVGSVIAGIVLFGEPSSPVRLFWLALIIAGVLGLQATT